ncbi:iron donor protein CyaY [Candidatus Paracaedibacter symbiosus]|uniref:iron donor protein CyaY n=1 Tax=Candidatus Paracaedibacter symbiosus TaxID=244582 RepID=UPI000A02220D|nr:iron donor protein CyaY [Candidatus Paracaedibacter symbiosus]
MMSFDSFDSIAQQTLHHLADHLEAQTDLDIELTGLQLTICDDRRQTFLLNFHGPTNQMWLSSPATGAHHFQWNGTAWVSTRTELSLFEILSADMQQLFKETVEF